MPDIEDIASADVVILYTQIGRGHPSYLDGIIDRLESNYPEIAYVKSDVFSISHGCPLLGWNMVRRLYRMGGRGGMVSAVYGAARHRAAGQKSGSMATRLLRRDILKFLAGYTGPVLVAHPMLARMLADSMRVIYQHGELAAPGESIVPGCEWIFVPIDRTAAEFTSAGISPDRLFVSGQCIETGLIPIAKNAFEKRLKRLAGRQSLTAALFSSGAYPREHLARLRLVAKSLNECGHTIYLFLGQSNKVAREFTQYFQSERVAVTADLAGSERLKIISSASRHEENDKVASVFDALDFFIAPAHERTNWSVGLGLPQLVLTPHIGSYAPLNAQFALASGTAVEIPRDDDTSSRLGQWVSRLQAEGALTRMAANGFGRLPIDGFEVCTQFLAQVIRDPARHKNDPGRN